MQKFCNFYILIQYLVYLLEVLKMSRPISVTENKMFCVARQLTTVPVDGVTVRNTTVEMNGFVSGKCWQV